MTVLISTGGAPASGGAAVVVVDGQVDVYNAAELREALLGALASDAARIVVDVSGLQLVDSTGVGILAGACRRVRTSGRTLEVVGASARIQRVFEVTGLDRLLAEVHPDTLAQPRA